MLAFDIKPDVYATGVVAMTVPFAGSIGTHDGVVSSSDDSSSAPRAVAADIAACPDDDAGIGAAAQCCVTISAMAGVHASMMGAFSSRLNSAFRVICSSVI